MEDIFSFKNELLSRDPEPRVLLLLSGGKDSVCCLYLFSTIKKVQLEAIFFKHSWGSEISRNEAARHCKKLCIPYHEIDYTEPLKHAWATSIHKAQGQTLGKVHLRLGRGCFSPGQLYTALTRVKDFDSLTLDRAIRYEDALTDSQVMAFHQETFPNID